jgi:hypothetical protein
VGALSGAVALTAIRGLWGKYSLLSGITSFWFHQNCWSATRPWKLACWDCHCVVWQLVVWFSWRWLLKARIMAMCKHFFWNWEF